jgi:hypothetical protein
MTAVYNGDVTLAPSTSSVLLQVVAQATSTPALTSSPNPSTVGQTVTFTGACGQRGVRFPIWDPARSQPTFSLISSLQLR